MESEAAVIPARSRKEAMEWSLVLASQEIESTIEPPSQEHGWQLALNPADYPRALEALRLYRAENRARRWRQELPLEGLIFDWRSLVWFVVLVGIYMLSDTFPAFRDIGVMDTEKVRAGEWWRVFTAVTLHHDVPHLISNVTFGVLLLGLAMGSFGPGIALLASYLTGAGANVALLFLYPAEHRSLGASGMVMGALGLLAGQSLSLWRSGVSAKQLIVRGVLAGFMLLVLLGLNPTTDVAAHVSGFGAGIILGAVLGWRETKLARAGWVNRLAEVSCAMLVVASWAFALRNFSRVL